MRSIAIVSQDVIKVVCILTFATTFKRQCLQHHKRTWPADLDGTLRQLAGWRPPIHLNTYNILECQRKARDYDGGKILFKMPEAPPATRPGGRRDQKIHHHPAFGTPSLKYMMPCGITIRAKASMAQPFRQLLVTFPFKHGQGKSQVQIHGAGVWLSTIGKFPLVNDQ